MSTIQPSVVCIGTATLDMVLGVPPPLPIDGRIVATNGTIAGGGPAATAAVALARAGIAASFIGGVGDDVAGRFIRENLGAEGIDISGLQVIRGAASAFSAVLVDPISGARTILTRPGTGAAVRLRDQDLARCRAAEWVHVDQEGWPAVHQLRDAGVDSPVSVDGGNPIADLNLSQVTLYAPAEASLLAAARTDDLEAAMAWALEQGPPLVVVTRGAGGSAALARFDVDAPRAQDRLRAGAWDRRPSRAYEPAPAVAVVSTLGAGDVFHGALLASLSRGASIRDALRIANLVAALSCQALDGRSGIPDRVTFESAIRSGALAADSGTGDEGGAA